MGSSANIARFFRQDVSGTALTALAELNGNYREAEKVMKQRLPVEIKYVLRVLRRSANNPTLAAKLKNKKQRLDADTIDLFSLDNNATPTRELILERICVLEKYRKLHSSELGRYHCGKLRQLYELCGEHPRDHKLCRAFVVEALTWAGICFPDLEKHPDRLDDWINTPVEPLSPAIHCKAAQQAAAGVKSGR